jgi:putative CocE/NonD family hydrolase
VTLLSEIAGRSLRLPRPRTRDVHVVRDLRVEMDDGAVLLADRWLPVAGAGRAGGEDGGPPPVVLVRSPYGRRGFFGLVYGRLLAERGFQVVLQSVRGTFGSEGDFAPFDERADGLATLRWLQRQPWCRGPIGMIGSSYMGIVQWAMAEPAGGALGALSPSISASHVHGQAYGGGSVSLETALSWVLIVALQERRLAPLHILRGLRRRLPGAFETLPLGQLDELLTGAAVPFYREWFAETGREDPYWVARDYAAGVPRIAAPVQLVGGWSDIFLPWMVEDFVALRRAGREAQLVIGPWAHMDLELLAASTRAGIAWLRAHLLGEATSPAGESHQAPVRVWVGGGARAWRELEEWPPPDARPWRLHLQPGGGLGPEAARGLPDPAFAVRPSQASGLPATSQLRYDPADPTPSLGGPTLLARAPVVENAPLEARRDVLVFTTPTLQHDVEAIGPVEAEIHLRSDNLHADLFVRVCDVDPAGRSLNVCDALVRLTPEQPPPAPDGSRKVVFALWPTAHRFDRHHRIRVLVAGGAHPRYARNTGTGESLATATRLVPVEHELLHDPEHPSAVTLTVAAGRPSAA